MIEPDERHVPAQSAPSEGMRYRLAYLLSIWFGCGRVPLMPGTIGTLGAIPLYVLVAPYGWLAVALAALAVTVVGIWAATVVARQMNQKDPQIICIDEVAGVLWGLTAAPDGWKGTLAGVVLFRLCDQFKPWPARAAERLPLGWGVVMDDVLAGFWTIIGLLLLRLSGLLH